MTGLETQKCAKQVVYSKKAAIAKVAKKSRVRGVQKVMVVDVRVVAICKNEIGTKGLFVGGADRPLNHIS
jgi:hypothetical protein